MANIDKLSDRQFELLLTCVAAAARLQPLKAIIITLEQDTANSAFDLYDAIDYDTSQEAFNRWSGSRMDV